jgi:hypothetical protein
MLDLLTLLAAITLLFYALYASEKLVPRNRPLETAALWVLCAMIGAVGASPWNKWLPDASWPSDVLVIALAVIVTVWRKEAAVFVQCKFGGGETDHPVRRRSDFVPFDASDMHHAKGGKAEGEWR